MRWFMPLTVVLVLCIWWGWGRQSTGTLLSDSSVVQPQTEMGTEDKMSEPAHHSLGMAPPGRGSSRSANRSDDQDEEKGREQPYPSPEPYMNGEVVAWVLNHQDTDWNDVVLVSPDCGIRANFRDGQAFVLAPPGECEFHVVTAGPTQQSVSEVQMVTVSAGETTSVEWVLGPLPKNPDTGH